MKKQEAVNFLLYPTGKYHYEAVAEAEVSSPFAQSRDLLCNKFQLRQKQGKSIESPSSLRRLRASRL